MSMGRMYNKSLQKSNLEYQSVLEKMCLMTQITTAVSLFCNIEVVAYYLSNSSQ